MTKQKFKEAISQSDNLFMNIVFKDGSEMEVSKEQLVFTASDISRGRLYILTYDDTVAGEELEIRISDIAEIIPLEDEDEEDWEDEYDDEDEDWDDEDEDWDDEDEDWDDEDDEDWDDEL